MERSTRNVLIFLGVVALGVTAYILYDKYSKKKHVNVGVTKEAKANKLTFTK